MGGCENAGAKSIRCILSGVVACDIFLIGGQPYVTVCGRGEGVRFGPKCVTHFLNGPLYGYQNFCLKCPPRASIACL